MLMKTVGRNVIKHLGLASGVEQEVVAKKVKLKKAAMELLEIAHGRSMSVRYHNQVYYRC